MSRNVDLHLHSTRSDGTLSPAELVHSAAGAGLAAVALCDHDNIDGIEEAAAAGRALGVEIISGVELSVIWEDFEDVHLLGYGFDHHDAELRRALVEIRLFREGRNELILQRVNERLVALGRKPIPFAEIQARAGGTLGRPHIAMALLDLGYVKNTEEAFQRYLVPCNVPKRFFPVGEAIEMIRRVGGITVLAHPSLITRDRRKFRQLLDALVGLGLDGIEAWSSGATNEEVDFFITEARRRSLIVTGGSDFHGIEGGEIAIGSGRGNLRVPFSCVEEIQQALARRQGRE